MKPHKTFWAFVVIVTVCVAVGTVLGLLFSRVLLADEPDKPLVVELPLATRIIVAEIVTAPRRIPNYTGYSVTLPADIQVRRALLHRYGDSQLRGLRVEVVPEVITPASE